MTATSSDGRKRPKRTSFAPHSRSWGGRGLQGPKPEKAPGKRTEAADAALAAILEMFESGELPEMIARTYIARLEGLSPAANWSLGNQLTILRAGTTDARGFQQWKHVGRNVCKGSRAVYILGPRTCKRTETDAQGEEVTRPIVTGFVGIPVFRYEDTEGLPIEREQYDPPSLPPLYDVAQALGVSVEYAPTPGDGTAGFYQPNRERIVLCSHDASTFLHELAHVAHRRVLQDRDADLDGGQVPSQEIVAETVAASLCQLYGLDGYLYDGAAYVARYANGGNPARAAIKVLGDVQKCLYLLLESAAAAGASIPEPVAA